ncbi:DUF5682 family protein [Hahella sp. CR1]|uniref:DUF5682 family protein n=1 Tax=Hahella sp. CR1 TaxID=2992807 RepID=UPI002441196B|nr:DUF5682 family protein [Hahella sp. CR1]MDG9670101.1 DUF5682 family protein [Hahella sp. CR1]
MLINDKILYLGIRHHGPGSTASMLKALVDFQPEILLVEGPQEAEPLLEHLHNEQLQPPVAQLIYAGDDYRDSVFYPFTEFSPEWQAMHFARRNNLPLRFIDLPQTHSLALARQARQEAAAAAEAAEQEMAQQQKSAEALDESTASQNEVEADAPAAEALTDENDGSEQDSEPSIDSLALSGDPLDALAAAAGFSDGERWWEHVVEQHSQGAEVFAAIADAMGALRAEASAQKLSDREARREAWMRSMVRKAEKEGFQRIAVICGAWHVPALVRKVAVKDDNALIKGLPKIKLSATWIPWTYDRISYRSGYGAGVDAPGWYEHIWRYAVREGENGAPVRDGISASWLARAARELREQGFDVAPSSVIEAVRMADTLAALREKPQPSLDEMNETIQTLFCFGDAAPLALLQRKLLVGDRIGTVPENLPKTPLQADLQAQQKSLRLKVSTVEEDLELDLRKDNGKLRSALFHRLNLLGVKWARLVSDRSGKGTFKEIWRLQWQPEFELNLIEQSLWGNNIATAAMGYALEQLRNASKLSDITAWVDRLLLADLPDAIQDAIIFLQQQAATVNDVDQLMAALPRLVNIVRYGDVRGADTSILHHVIEGFCARINIGLVYQCRNVDEDAAKAHAKLIADVSDALKLYADAERLSEWWRELSRLARQTEVNGVILGRCYRLLLGADQISGEDAANALSFALSAAEEPAHAAAWIEGLLEGSGLLLIHDDRLWTVLDAYLCALPEERFMLLLPLLRRTFSSFADGERANLKRKSRSATATAAGIIADPDFDYSRVNAMLPLLETLLGLGANNDTENSSS